MSAQPQHLQALDRANVLRHERAALRVWVKEPGETAASRERLAQIMDAPIPPCLNSLQLEKFLKWGWKMTPARMRGVYAIAWVSAFKSLGDLTDRQRVVIARVLRASAADVELAQSGGEFAEWFRRAA